MPAIFGGLMGLVISVPEPWIFTMAGLATLVCAGPMVNSTYTIWNWIMLLGLVVDRALRRQAIPHLLPYLVVNSWAIFTSFNACGVLYPNHFKELAGRLDYSMARFHVMNTIGHFVPPALVTAWFAALGLETKRAACEWTRLVPLPVASLAFHFLWALRVAGGLRLDHVYLRLPKQHWYVAWAIATATHLVVGVWLADACRPHH